MTENNPYTKATGTYSNALSSNAADGRDLESAVLIKSALKMELIAKKIEAGEKVRLEDIEDTLKNNRKIWEIFLDNMEDPKNALPKEIKNNIASLAMFIFKHTNEVLVDTSPSKFRILININRNIAMGLNKKPATPKHPRNIIPKVPQELAGSISREI